MINIKLLQQTLSFLQKTTVKIFGILIIISGFFLYWYHTKHYISTDNAYINANRIEISSQVSGQIVKLNIQNNQFVKAGTLLFAVDPFPFQLAITQGKAQLIIDGSILKHKQKNVERLTKLAKINALSMQELDNAKKDLEVAIATLELHQASLAQAEFNLQNSQIIAPTTGYISNMTLTVGNTITAFKPLFTLINNEQFWVDANFKETELLHIKKGQVAKINIDMYPSYTCQGIVDSISGGTGAAFSLLPPQNATGNWVKITQRVPVKIYITNPTVKYPLRIGATATVTIDIKSKN